MYRQIKRELSGARFSKRVHVSPSRPSWRRINPPLVDGKNRRSKPRTTITGVEKSESRNLCLGKRQNKQLERGLHGTEREKEREREGIGILSAGYKSAHSMSRTSHHRGKTEGRGGREGATVVGVKLAKGIGFLDISQKTGTWERSGAPHRFKGPACIAKNGGLRSSSLHERNRKLLRFPASKPGSKRNFCGGSDRAASLRETYEWMNCASPLRIFFFFFLFFLFLSLSFFLFLPVVYWNGFIGNIVDSAEIYCAEESCVLEEEWWMDARLMGLLRVLVRNMGGGFCIVILLGEKVSAYSLFVIYIYICIEKLLNCVQFILSVW